MLARLARLWRIARGAAAFAAFGAMALAVSAALSVLRLGVRDPARVRALGQLTVWRACRTFAAVLRGLGLVEIDARELERHAGPGPRLLVANHPTLLDTVLQLAYLPQADCVVSPAWARNPFLRGAVAAADYIRNDGGAGVVEECACRLRDGRVLLLFPEGTRSPRGRLHRLRRGAAHIALVTGQPVWPVLVTCEPLALVKGEKWYVLPEGRLRYTFRVGEPLFPQPYLERGESNAIAARKLTEELRETFLKGLNLG